MLLSVAFLVCAFVAVVTVALLLFEDERFAPPLPTFERFGVSALRRRAGFMKLLGIVAVVFYAGGALAAGDEAAPANTAALESLAVHAVAVAAFIRTVIALLRSPLLGLLWGRVPEPVRVLGLLALTGIAVAFDHIAVGTPPLEAFASAFVGLFGVVGGHEMAKRVVPSKPPSKVVAR